MLTNESEANAARAQIESAIVRNWGRLEGILFSPSYPIDDNRSRELFIGGLLEALIAAFQEVQREHYNPFRAAIEKISIERLNAHGLYGAQLSAKVQATEVMYQQYEAVRNNGSPAQRAEGEVGKKAKGFLRIFDEWLKSVIKAAGLGDALEEIKGITEAAIDDGPDRRFLGDDPRYRGGISGP